ncbi:MAG: hypothetical protein M3Z66_05430 [Chloroflexota bacterium]|nr:hypothetical protein [Chloroflexota bacterium]
MTAPHASDIINGYLSRLEAETAGIPRTERRELIDGVREHIAAARDQMPDETDAALLNLLDRLGDPAELASEERDRLGLRVPDASRSRLLEVAAVVLTLLIWPIGIILLWTSNAWNVRDKLIGTLILPGGLFTSLTVFFTVAIGGRRSCQPAQFPIGHQVHQATTCSGGISGIIGVLASLVFVLILFAPILTAIYLAIRLRRGPGSRAVAAFA